MFVLEILYFYKQNEHCSVKNIQCKFSIDRHCNQSTERVETNTTHEMKCRLN